VILHEEYMKDDDESGVLVRQIRVTISDSPEFLAELRQIGTKYKCVLICFNRDVISGYAHVQTAVMHAERAFAEGQAISRTLEVESLLYAAGTRQTSLIGAFGVHSGSNECYLCISPGKSAAYADILDRVSDADHEDWEGIDPEKKWRLQKIFGITDAELAITGDNRIEDLILERVALLAVNR
jgi:KEOPS complex subunit Cgi121